jgi:hypothetical protein
MSRSHSISSIGSVTSSPGSITETDVLISPYLTELKNILEFAYQEPMSNYHVLIWLKKFIIIKPGLVRPKHKKKAFKVANEIIRTASSEKKEVKSLLDTFISKLHSKQGGKRTTKKRHSKSSKSNRNTKRYRR